MPLELLALIDKPVLLVAILFVGAMIGIGIEKFVAEQKRAEWRRKNALRRRSGQAWRWKTNGQGQVHGGPWGPKLVPAPAKLPDPADQLRTVMHAEFKPQRLLNKSEARLFRAIDNMVLGMRPDWQGWRRSAWVRSCGPGTRTPTAA